MDGAPEILLAGGVSVAGLKVEGSFDKLRARLPSPSRVNSRSLAPLTPHCTDAQDSNPGLKIDKLRTSSAATRNMLIGKLPGFPIEEGELRR